MSANEKYLIVGAGFSGAVLARQLIENTDVEIHIIDERQHIAGNCHTERDTSTNIMVHTYGPHIFNTNRQDVWDYISRFGEFHPFINRVKAEVEGQIYSMPVNLHTINQFFKTTLNPQQARHLIEQKANSLIEEPQNFEEQALKFLGPELYYAFFYGYTKKQWGCEPSELPASILKRLPLRFTYDDNYYNAHYQGIPINGYTEIVRNILNHERIKVSTGVAFDHSMSNLYNHVFYSGPIDRYFEYKLGRLSYRTVTFERSEAEGDHLGNAVINYPDANVAYTRIHEHKHFTPWEKHDKTVYFKEYSKETMENDTPYYPKRLAADMNIFERYLALARTQSKISFIGRLGTYKYMNMDQAIGEILDFSQEVISSRQKNQPIPALSQNI